MPDDTKKQTQRPPEPQPQCEKVADYTQAKPVKRKLSDLIRRLSGKK